MAILKKRKVRRKLTERDYERQKLAVIESYNNVSLFAQDEEDAEKRKHECSLHFWVFCHTYLWKYFTTETQAEWHDALVDALNWIEHPTVAAAPRGFAKSTIVSFALILWCMLYEKKHFIVLIMENEDKATMQTWRILLELQYNPKVLQDFGKLVSDLAGRGDFTTTSGIRLTALGAGMSARGLVNAQYRPDLMICDDMETRALARNPRRVDQLLDTVLSDYLQAVCATGWAFLVIGTVICKGSMLDRLLDPEGLHPEGGGELDGKPGKDGIIRLKFRAIERDEAGKERSTWEEMHPLASLHRTLQNIGPTRFSAEKQNEPQENEGTFKEKWFRYAKELPPGLDKSRWIIQVDPSYSDTGNHKAMYLMASYKLDPDTPGYRPWYDSNGKAFEKGEYTILIRSFNRRCSMDEMITTLYDWCSKHPVFMVRIDGSYSQKYFYKSEFGNYEKKSEFGRLPLKFTDLSKNKTDKILALEPTMQRGFIVFMQGDSADIRETEIQFTRFGETGVDDDGPDAIAEGIDSLARVTKKKGRVTCV